ncbi:MAG: DUF1343 domain-containing protein [Thermodesulfobacteriota bacterium]
MVTLGIEELIASPLSLVKDKRLGLLCNQASTNRSFRHSRDLIMASFPGQLSCLFSPQHGFFAEKQDNMVESDHGRDQVSDLPVFSLYGETRKPTPEMMDHVDVVLVDIVDVGTRVYTFMYTLAYMLEAAAQAGKTVVVLDRPNPIGGEAVEGNILEEEYRSFVGLYPLPMRHGLTFAELALLFNDHFSIGAELHVVKMQGWQRDMHFPDCKLPWVFPSPNMPSYAASLVYPGQVIWEGTNISEGRGTSLPFELFGAPFLNCDEVLDNLAHTPLPGAFLRPLQFEPTFHKWQGQVCNGFQLHVTDSAIFRPYRTTLAILQAIMTLYPELFAYKQPPYEYEYDILPMDLILGSQEVRLALEEGTATVELEEGWQDALDEFDRLRRNYFLY